MKIKSRRDKVQEQAIKGTSMALPLLVDVVAVDIDSPDIQVTVRIRSERNSDMERNPLKKIHFIFKRDEVESIVPEVDGIFHLVNIIGALADQHDRIKNILMQEVRTIMGSKILWSNLDTAILDMEMVELAASDRFRPILRQMAINKAYIELSKSQIGYGVPRYDILV